jgi:hypothetical protein
MRKSTFLIAMMAFAAQARGDVVLTLGASIAVDERESYTTTYTQLGNDVVGSGSFLIDPHVYSVFYEVQSTGLVSSLTLSGSLDGLRHISAQGDDTYSPYASMGDSATFNLNVAMASPSTFTFGGVVSAMASPGTWVGGGQVGNGIPDPFGDTTPGPGFSFALDSDVVAAANASFLSGTPFVLEISGSGVAYLPDVGFVPSLEGDLSGLQLVGVSSVSEPFGGVAPVPEPSTIVLCGVAGLIGLVYHLPRRIARRAG